VCVFANRILSDKICVLSGLLIQLKELSSRIFRNYVKVAVEEKYRSDISLY
jgi:hypothetical protein